jgi:hypothetical protein
MSVERKPAGVELIDLLDRILDRGIVVDASNLLHLNGGDLTKQNTHVVIASVETHLEYSEARVLANLLGRRALASEMQPRHAEARRVTPKYQRR